MLPVTNETSELKPLFASGLKIYYLFFSIAEKTKMQDDKKGPADLTIFSNQ
jgi:hypothetical protein